MGFIKDGLSISYYRFNDKRIIKLASEFPFSRQKNAYNTAVTDNKDLVVVITIRIRLAMSLGFTRECLNFTVGKRRAA